MEAEREPTNNKAKSWIEILGIGIATISLVGVVLSLLGFGVALSAEEVLGIPYGILLGSPFDALQLSTVAVSRGLVHLFIDYPSYMHRALTALILTVGAIFLWTLVLLVVRLILNKTRLQNSRWLVQLLEKPRLRGDSMTLILQRGAFHLAVGAIATPIVALIALMGVIVAATGLAIFPALGMDAGREHLKTYVISAERCIPMHDRRDQIARMEEEQRRRERGEKHKGVPGATCVRINRNGQEVLEGRVAFALATSLVVYEPATGTSTRISIADATIESISALATDTASAPVRGTDRQSSARTPK